MTKELYGLRVLDSLSLSLATVTTALTLAQEQGVTAYSRFLSVVMIGMVIGGLATFVALNLLRTPAVARLSPWASAAGRLVLSAAAADLFHDGRATVITGGILVAVSSVVLNSMFHSLSSQGDGGIRSRTGLLAATASGALLGTLVAGAAIEGGWEHWLLLIQVLGAAAGWMVTTSFVRAFPHVRPQRTDLRAAWRRSLPITWRVPLIASLSFSLGSLAPGVVTDLRGPAAGGVTGAVYLLGALGSSLALGLGERTALASASVWMCDHRQWFLPTALGSLLWMLVTAPLPVCLAAVLTAGVVLHLVQAAFEQATADLNEPQDAGPSIVALHSIAGIATAVSLTLLPPTIATIGYLETVALTCGLLLLLAVADLARRGTPAAHCS